MICKALHVGIFLVCLTGLADAAPQKEGAAQAESIYQKGLAALKRGDLNSARISFEHVLKLAPRSPEAHNSLGFVLFTQGDLDSAISHFRTALKLKADFPQAETSLASARSEEHTSELQSRGHLVCR